MLRGVYGCVLNSGGEEGCLVCFVACKWPLVFSEGWCCCFCGAKVKFDITTM